MQMIAIIGSWELILNNFGINRDRNSYVLKKMAIDATSRREISLIGLSEGFYSWLNGWRSSPEALGARNGTRFSYISYTQYKKRIRI